MSARAGRGLPAATPRLTIVAGYPPLRTVGGGKILGDLLGEWPSERQEWILPHGNTPLSADDIAMSARADGSEPWNGPRQVRTHNILQRAGIALVRMLRLCVGQSPRPSAVIFVPWGGPGGTRLAFVALILALRRGALVVYELDEWRATAAARSRLAALGEMCLHGPLLRKASKVFAISPQLGESLTRRYNVPVSVLASGADESLLGVARRTRPVGVRSLVFLGAVYSAQQDAILSVISTIREMALDWRLQVYTTQDPADLAAQGVGGAGVEVREFVSGDDLRQVLRDADALLLPFSFLHTMREVVSTSLPTKTADYMASGVPIVVHAPSWSTISQLARKEGWAVVVDERTCEAVAAGLRRIEGTEERRRVSESARIVAGKRHSLEQNRKTFVDAIHKAAESVS